MTRVKICGLSEIEPALAAVEAGADFLGMVFAPSRRQVTPEQAKRIAQSVRDFKNHPSTSLRASPLVVGVFVDASAEEINRIAELCRLDYVQLSGNESWRYCLDVKKPIIKVIHVTQGQPAEEVISEIEKGYRLLSKEELTCLLDTHSAAVYGGTGQVFNWRLAKEVSARFPVIVAGGLTPANVSQLVREVQPWGVDVSSGVESDGQKDISKIRAFVKAARSV